MLDAVVVEPAKRGRKPAELPVLRTEDGTRMSRYAVEKAVGLRRENGSAKLRRLTHRHYQIIGLHIEGKSLEQICSMLHVSISTVSRVLNDPLAKGVLQKVYKHREGELHALTGVSLGVVRKVLVEDHTVEQKLKAVDKVIKFRETMLDKESGKESAEDVVQRILQNATVHGDVNIQVNNGD